MRKKIILIVLLLISYLAVFVIGSITGGNISKSYLTREFKKANAPIILSHYEIFRNIARNINAGKYSDAKCSAELGASSNLDEIKTCLADASCMPLIEHDVVSLSPEVVGKAPLDFNYIPRKGNTRRCE